MIKLSSKWFYYLYKIHEIYIIYVFVYIIHICTHTDTHTYMKEIKIVKCSTARICFLLCCHDSVVGPFRSGAGVRKRIG